MVVPSGGERERHPREVLIECVILISIGVRETPSRALSEVRASMVLVNGRGEEHLCVTNFVKGFSAGSAETSRQPADQRQVS